MSLLCIYFVERDKLKLTLTQERETGRRPELGDFFLATHSKKTRTEDGTTRLVASEEVQSRAVSTNISDMKL